jgi:hypothetical protein
MKWILPSIALALAPMASSCASMPVLGSWTIDSYCSAGGDERTWVRTDAPTNAETYRRVAAADTDTSDSIPSNSREYWYAGQGGEVKLCMTNLQRSGGRRDWCNPRRVVWWTFRDAEAGPVIDNSHQPVCIT